jgi:hypothetical protein
VSLRARELSVGKLKPHNEQLFFEEFANVPQTLLKNFYESFAVLFDSRLRAYTNFLARQGIALAAKDPDPDYIKTLQGGIEAMLEMGGKISMDSIRTSFEIEGSQGIKDKADTQTLPLQLKVQMRLLVPCITQGNETISITVAAPGKITGKYFTG